MAYHTAARQGLSRTVKSTVYVDACAYYVRDSHVELSMPTSPFPKGVDIHPAQLRYYTQVGRKNAQLHFIRHPLVVLDTVQESHEPPISGAKNSLPRHHERQKQTRNPTQS